MLWNVSTSIHPFLTRSVVQEDIMSRKEGVEKASSCILVVYPLISLFRARKKEQRRKERQQADAT